MERSSDPRHLTAASQRSSADHERLQPMDHESRQNRMKALSLEVVVRESQV